MEGYHIRGCDEGLLAIEEGKALICRLLDRVAQSDNTESDIYSDNEGSNYSDIESGNYSDTNGDGATFSQISSILAALKKKFGWSMESLVWDIFSDAVIMEQVPRAVAAYRYGHTYGDMSDAESGVVDLSRAFVEEYLNSSSGWRKWCCYTNTNLDVECCVKALSKCRSQLRQVVAGLRLHGIKPRFKIEGFSETRHQKGTKANELYNEIIKELL